MNTPTKTDEDKSIFQIISEYAQALVGAVLLAILIRGFVFEPFKIPSESMVPTLLVGDHIFVSRYQYGLRVPFTKLWLKRFDDPKRSDVVVFNFPQDEDVDFIKRVIGVPGDMIVIKGGIVYVNGQPSQYQSFSVSGQDPSNSCVMNLTPESEQLVPAIFKQFPHFLLYRKFDLMLETLPGGAAHMVQRSKEKPIDDNANITRSFTIPADQYFVMGDNRDHSHDSRFWGLVPRENLKGKAQRIWLSLNHEKTHCSYNLPTSDWLANIRWDRFWRKIM